MTPIELLVEIMDQFAPGRSCYMTATLTEATYLKIRSVLSKTPRRCDTYNPQLAGHIMQTHYCNKQPKGFCDGRECDKCSFAWFTDKAKPEDLEGIDIAAERAAVDEKYS